VSRIAAGCVLAATITGCERPTTPSDTAASEPRAVHTILVLGDSLALSPSAEGAFPAVLADRIRRQGLPWRIVTEATTGSTAADGLARAPAIIDGVQILLLELGANDGLRGVAVPTIEQRLAGIIELAQSRGTRVLLCGMEVPPTRTLAYSLEFHRLYPRLAERYRVALVPFLLEGVALIPAMNGPDGVHPNSEGARRIADTVWPHLRPMMDAQDIRRPGGP